MSLAESLKNSFTSISTRVQESAWYISLSDRYMSLNPSQQKLALFASITVFLLLVLFYPFTMLTSSYDNLSQYDAKRELIRDMFRVYRESSAQPDLPTPPTGPGLKSAIDSVLSQSHLLPEQIISVSESSSNGSLMPAAVTASVYDVKLAKLNLKQIVDIGSSLVAISESIKMTDLSMIANASDTRYFDVSYKLSSLNVPAAEVPPIQEPEPAPHRKNGKDN